MEYIPIKELTYITFTISVYFMFLYLYRVLFPKHKINPKEIVTYVFDINNNELTKEQQIIKDEFKLAGFPLGLNHKKFAIYRDMGLYLTIGYLNYDFFANHRLQYPIYTIIAIILIYTFIFGYHRYSLIHKILDLLKELFNGRKNAELFNLYQMFLNEFEQAEDNKETYNVEYLMKDFKKHTKSLDRSIDVFLENCHRYPPSLAYEMFSDDIGTPDAKNISGILFEISQTHAKEGKQMLENRYEEFKKRRQELHRKRMKLRSGVAFLIAFTGALMVLICVGSVFYLQFEEQREVFFNNG